MRTTDQTLVDIYTRVSDSSQVDSYSLDAQERQSIEFCRSKGWVVRRVHREEGRSARFESIRKRPIFKQALDDAANYDILLVHTLDRFSRNMKVMLEAVSVLENHGAALASVTENIDWSTAEGRMVARSIGNFSEFFSDMLSKHTRKGIDERARQGMHLGSIPFGYQSCWKQNGKEKVLECNPEHPGGIHVHPTEGPAVSRLFQQYATGTTTLATLASWLNHEGFRTRNTKPLLGADGEMTAGPRWFTTSSIRGLLNNAFFTGKVKHKGKLHPGLHDPLVSQSVFDQVQSAMKKNSGRSNTMRSHPEREYLLKGLNRCAYCGMPMWAQTYKNGQQYYREHHGSRGAGECVNRSGSIPCRIPDEQMGRIITAIMLPDSWMDRLLAKVQLADEVKRVNREREKVGKRLRKLGEVYLNDDLMEYDDYKARKRKLEDQLASLVVPGVDAVQEAGKLLEDLPDLWDKADLGERRKMLMTMLEAVYIECKEERRIVAIKPKPAFKPLFEIALTKADSGVVLLKDDDEKDGDNSGNLITQTGGDNGLNRGEHHRSGEIEGKSKWCLWWRRGRPRLRFPYILRHTSFTPSDPSGTPMRSPGKRWRKWPYRCHRSAHTRFPAPHVARKVLSNDTPASVLVRSVVATRISHRAAAYAVADSHLTA